MSPPKPISHLFSDGINKLLGTNAVPTSVEKFSILNALMDQEEELQEVRDTIEREEQKLQTLIFNEQKLIMKIAPYKALLSPFRRMPNEILGRIFIACLPGDHAPVIDSRQPPLLLTQISSHLRQVALSTHRLWTTISIPIVLPCYPMWMDGRDRMTSANQTMVKYTMIVDEWLRRTGACDVEIFVNESGTGSDDLFIDDMFNVLIRLAARWKTISLRCSEYSIQRFWELLGESYSQFNFPRLERLGLDILALDNFEDHRTPDQFNNVSQIPHALRLRSVHLVLPSNNYDEYNFQWSSLTFLSLGSASYSASLDVVIKILEFCTNLLECKLYIRVLGQLKMCSCLPYLKNLSLSFDEKAWFNSPFHVKNALSFCSHLDTPSLKRITYDASVDFLPLLGLIHRMGNHITHLTVTNFEVPTELVECLKACPLLVSLDGSRQDGIPKSIDREIQWLRTTPWAWSLRSWDTAGDQLLRYLMAAGDIDNMVQEQLCPHLEHLTYHISDGPMSCGVIRSFILDKCSSKGGDHRLKGLSALVHGGHQNLEHLRYSIEARILDGLRLHLSPARNANHKVMENSTRRMRKEPEW